MGPERSCRSREAGGFPLGELAISGVILLVFYGIILMAVLKGRAIGAETPPCLSRLEGLAARLEKASMPSGKDPGSWTPVDLSDLLPGESGQEITCPEVGEAYACSVRGSDWRICCPDTGNHLGIGEAVSCRGRRGWDHPAASEEGDMEDPLWESSVDDRGALVLSRGVGWPACGVYVIFGLAVLHALVFPYAIIFEGETRKKAPWKLILMYPAGVCLLLIVWAVILGPLGLPWFYSPEITFTPEGGVEAAGRVGPVALWRESVEGKEILAVGRVTDPPSVLLHFRDEQGEIRTWRWELGSEENVDRLASLIRSRPSGEEARENEDDPAEGEGRAPEPPAGE